MSAFNLDSFITERKDAIDRFCEKWQIAEFAVVGDALRGELPPERKIAVMISTAPKTRHGLFSHIDMEDELSAIFGRRVDLVSRPAGQHSHRDLLDKTDAGEAQMVVSQDDAPLGVLLAAAGEAQSFTADREADALADDSLLRGALTWAVVRMGRAASALSDEFRARYPALPWNDLTALADALLAADAAVEPARLWQAASATAPLLAAALTPSDTAPADSAEDAAPADPEAESS